MITIYFSYRKKENPQNTGNFYTPSFDFTTMYPEMEGVVVMRDELLNQDDYKLLPNGKISGVNLGKVEADETMLASFGKDLAYLETELLTVGAVYAMKIETEQTIKDFLSVYTTKSFEDLGKSVDSVLVA